MSHSNCHFPGGNGSCTYKMVSFQQHSFACWQIFGKIYITNLLLLVFYRLGQPIGLVPALNYITIFTPYKPIQGHPVVLKTSQKYEHTALCTLLHPCPTRQKVILANNWGAKVRFSNNNQIIWQIFFLKHCIAWAKRQRRNINTLSHDLDKSKTTWISNYHEEKEQEGLRNKQSAFQALHSTVETTHPRQHKESVQ